MKRITTLDPTSIFCPNMNCPARGKINEGNISRHSLKERRYKCSVCDKTFTETKGSAFYRLHHSQELVTRVVTLLSFGCPTQAIVAAFSLDERTVSSWRDRASQHCLSVHNNLVATPRDLGQVQMDELRVKQQGRVVWMALALMVSTRLWLGGVVSTSRDTALISSLVEKVRACATALCAGILFCTDGLKAYITAIREVFREPVVSGQAGRPRLQMWKRIFIAQAIKQYEQGRVVGIHRRVIFGSQAEVEAMIEKTQGRGVINTAFIERLNATFRQCLTALVGRGRAIARHNKTLEAGMYLVGTVYNFCCEHKSLRIEGLIGGHRWLERTPAMAAAITDHRWSVEELLSYHVEPSPWKPPKRRGRPSKGNKQLIARWFQ
jgi:transposase-like protein